MSKHMSKRTKIYWRSLAQKENSAAVIDRQKYEFREGDSELPSNISRRNFMSLISASVALAGLTACRKPAEKIIPYVKAPEDIIPGIPKYYATTFPFQSNAYGVVVESHEGRPTKIEGNPLHPGSKGGTNIHMQAAILEMYDPDRPQEITQNGSKKTWSAFMDSWQSLYPELRSAKGKGLAVLSESFSSPTLFRLKNKFRSTFPRAQWVTYEPVADDAIVSGFQMATGAKALPRYHMSKARVIAAFDADFIQNEGENVINIREFAEGRDPDGEMSRLYVIEPGLTATGGMADHRLAAGGYRTGVLLAGLANILGITSADEKLPVTISDKEQHWLEVLAADLNKNKGRSLIIAGRRQPAWVHALTYILNDRLMNNGTTCEWFPLTDKTVSDAESLAVLAESIKNKEITKLIILGGNPVYNTAVDINFSSLLKNVPTSIHVSYHKNETSLQTTWHLPRTHFLESWGDARAIDGSLSIIQPLIAPLFDDCRSLIEVLSLLTTGTEGDGYEEVRLTWKDQLPASGFEKQWRKILHDGILSGSALKPLRIKPQHGFPESIAAGILSQSEKKETVLELAFQASPALFDGRFANNAWLQELPDSISKLAWDNAALMGTITAKKMNLENEDLIILRHETRKLILPVWIIPGHAENCITVHLGYGRTAAGRIGNEIGSNAYPMRTGSNPYFIRGITISQTGQKYALASTQDHGSMEGRPLVREGSLDRYHEHPEFAREMVEHQPLVSLWKDHSYAVGYQWGMAIDLNKCVGCNTCVIACQSENNVPIVGKEQVRNGREMHWMRLDRYYSGDDDEIEVVVQPVACQQCENAPCEQVCPVAATVHDKEGLNVMTYNRCIGTRYCSNNCPYKVRRFNFFNYTKDLPEIVQLGQNPDVTIRSRGVMEKCTYCLQRINEAKIAAKNAGREIQDGEFQTACQQACPANAIVFGNINDAESEITKQKKSNRNYIMLEELNIRPRTSYLAKIRNPNPDLEEG